jgi:hypothetical protein
MIKPLGCTTRRVVTALRDRSPAPTRVRCCVYLRRAKGTRSASGDGARASGSPASGGSASGGSASGGSASGGSASGGSASGSVASDRVASDRAPLQELGEPR